MIVIMNCTEIGRGAEATVYRTVYRDRDAVVKIREPKRYRHPDLDNHLRSVRTRSEVRVMIDAREAGVRSPVVYDVDLEEGSIVMEYIEGVSVRDALEGHPDAAPEICKRIGEAVARLHNGKICHGDLTTSNMIIDEKGNICFIDFSLGDTRITTEEMGVDLRLLERAFTSAHSSIDGAFRYIIESYCENMPSSKQVLAKVEEIKGRARYT